MESWSRKEKEKKEISMCMAASVSSNGVSVGFFSGMLGIQKSYQLKESCRILHKESFEKKGQQHWPERATDRLPQ